MTTNILVVAVSNDNYGDTVIRVCFNALLTVALKNHGITDFNITNIDISNVAESTVVGHDIIYFAGGGVLKFDYLTFYKSIDEITRMAEEHGIRLFLTR